MTLAYVYPTLTEIAATGFDWMTSTIKCALLTQAYAAASPGTQTFFSEIQAHEVSGAGYTADGVTLASKTRVLSGRTTRLGAANPQWTGLTATARYAVFYISTGTASTSRLLAYMDFEVARVASAQLFTVVLPSSGLITVQGV